MLTEASRSQVGANVHTFDFGAFCSAVLEMGKDNHLAHTDDFTVEFNDQDLATFGSRSGHRRYVPFGVVRVVIRVAESSRHQNVYRRGNIFVSQCTNN